MGQNDRVRSTREDKAEARKKASVEQAQWRGYVNVELSKDDKVQFEAWTHTDDPWDVFAAAVACGYVVTVKENPNGTGAMASVTQRYAVHVNAGLCVTARASTPGVALLRVLFIVARLTVDGSWEEKAPVADPDRW